jgi:hypothetical protein
METSDHGLLHPSKEPMVAVNGLSDIKSVLGSISSFAIGAECTMDFKHPHTQTSKILRSGENGGHANALPIHLS